MQKQKFLRSVIILLLLSLLSGCAEFRPGFVHDNTWKIEGEFPADPDDIPLDGPPNGHFDEEGNWIPDDPTIGWTYAIPDISAGFIFDIHSLTPTPSLQIELLEFDIPGLPYLRTWKFDAGVGYQRAYGYLGPRITSIFEISVGGWVGWNWEDNELAYGVGFTIIKF